MIEQYFKGQKITALSFNENFETVENKLNDFEEIEPVPSGIICLWGNATIPTGWFLCDGNNGTPDLRNRFVAGVSQEWALGTTGGENFSTLTLSHLPNHAHERGTLNTQQSGGHQHTLFQATGSGTGDGTVNNRFWTGGQTLNTGASGAHSHSVSGSTANTGSGEAHENRPPYYALCFIMKG